jgi:hypothetical protein
MKDRIRLWCVTGFVRDVSCYVQSSRGGYAVTVEYGSERMMYEWHQTLVEAAKQSDALFDSMCEVELPNRDGNPVPDITHE